MYLIFLSIHILGGTSSLISGLIAMFSKKSGALHLRMGKIYYISMLTVVITAFLIQFVRLNPFLLMIACFTFYFVYMGKRVLSYKGKPTDLKTRDRYVIFAMITLGVFMIVYSIFGSVLPHVILFFGIGAIVQASLDLRNYSKQSKAKNWWLREHISKIGGSYIAATTAFVVVNAYRIVPNMPGYGDIIFWIGPGFIGNFVIIYALRKYTPKRKEKSVLEVVN